MAKVNPKELMWAQGKPPRTVLSVFPKPSSVRGTRSVLKTFRKHLRTMYGDRYAPDNLGRPLQEPDLIEKRKTPVGERVNEFSKEEFPIEAYHMRVNNSLLTLTNKKVKLDLYRVKDEFEGADRHDILFRDIEMLETFLRIHHPDSENIFKR